MRVSGRFWRVQAATVTADASPSIRGHRTEALYLQPNYVTSIKPKYPAARSIFTVLYAVHLLTVGFDDSDLITTGVG